MEYIKMFGNEKMISQAIDKVVEYYNTTDELNGSYSYITKDDVCVVWFCKTLQNYKIILTTPLLTDEFYEFTYNGNKHEAYLDVYSKMDNKVIKYE